MAVPFRMAAILTISITLVLLVSSIGAQNTLLYIYPFGSTSTLTQGVPMGSSIVFACTITGLSSYGGTFGYTELHALVNGTDTVICSAVASGNCASGSQASPFQSRSITVSVPTSSAGTTYTMTNAIVGDSINYYCKISAGNIMYSPATNSWTALQVYALQGTPSISFVGGSSVTFLAGQTLPQIQCSANVGAPYGWLQLSSSGFIGTWSAAPYPNFLSLVSNSTTLLSNSTYSMTYTFSYLYSGSSTYTLGSSNNGDTFVCTAYNSFVYANMGQVGSSSSLAIQVQYAVKSIAVTTSNALTSSFSGSSGVYALSVTQGTAISLTCYAQGVPTPTYTWLKTSGQNTVSIFGSTITGTVSVVETLILQCNASNTITAATTPYGTSQIAVVTVTIAATTTTTTTSAPGVASASLGGGAIAGIVIACIVVVAAIIFIIIWCVCCAGKKHPSKTEQPVTAMTANTQNAARSMMYEPEDKKQPLSMVSEMDIPYGDGAFEDTPRSRKPIVDPHAQSAAEYLDLQNGMNGGPVNGAPAYNQYASQPTTPNGMNSVPPTYPGGTSTLPRGTMYGTQPNPAYGTMNGYGMNGDGGYGAGTMA